MAAPVELSTGHPGGPAGRPSGGWQPLRVLGAASELSLALPAAEPTPSQLYAPRGVLIDALDGRTRVIAADTGNHRLMVWNDLPGEDGADCDLVIGQPDPRSEGPQAGGRGPERGLHLPTGLALADAPEGRLLLVADGWNHRLLGYDAALSEADPEPVWWFGQDSLSAIVENAGGDQGGACFYWPFGVTWHDGWLWVSDTGNRRVLGWQGLPQSGRAADVVLGQAGADRRDENRGGDVAGDSFRWPHAIAVLRGVLWVADAGNHRLLGWRLPLDGDRSADLVLGQTSFTTAAEMPHVPQGPARLRFPYAAAEVGDSLVVGDTANNRVLVWDAPEDSGAAASAVLGQDTFDAAGENRWTAVTGDSLCWPYGVSAATDARYGAVLAVADSGNNRVVLWNRP